MKKIGILTFHYADNCGALLQLFSLKSYLESCGHQVKIINYQAPELKKRNALFQNPVYRFYLGWKNEKSNLFKKLYKGIGGIAYSLKSIFHFKRTILIRRECNCFRKKYFSDSMTSCIHDIHDLEKISNSFDLIIIGSDQVWNIELMNGYIDKVYFLQSKKIKCKVVSYAGSAGNTFTISDKAISKLFANFNLISVREQQLREQLTHVLKKEIYLVADPVFLFNNDWWKKLILPNHYGNYILLYPIEYTEDLKVIINKILVQNSQKKLKVLELGYKRICPNSIIINQYSPITFLTLIYHAKFIVSNSFHATAFSIIFNKEFYTLKHSKRNMRIESLLNELGMNNRMVKNIDNFSINNAVFDTEKVNRERINNLWNSSTKFLNEVLQGDI